MLRNFDIDSAITIGSTQNGTAVPVDKSFDGFAVQCVVSAGSSPVGTLKLQASLDTGSSPTNWADVSNAVAITANGTTMFEVSQGSHYRYVRTVYTFTSGTATMTTTFNENK